MLGANGLLTIELSELPSIRNLDCLTILLEKSLHVISNLEKEVLSLEQRTLIQIENSFVLRVN